MLRSLVKLRPSFRAVRLAIPQSAIPSSTAGLFPAHSRPDIPFRTPARFCSSAGSNTLGKIETPKMYLQYTCKVCDHRNSKETAVINNEIDFLFKPFQYITYIKKVSNQY